MHITKEETGALTASVRMLITREDYEEKVTKTLKDYQRKASIPGFRPGKVPFGMISKMYRKGVLLDEINHLLSLNLQNFIEENNLKILGNPLPNKEKAADFDIDTQTEFEFVFDIGIRPEFTLKLEDFGAVDYYKITATDKMVDEQIDELRHRSKHNHEHDHDHEHEHEHEHEGQDQPAEEDLPELNEAFFSLVFPGADIKDMDTFRAKIKESIESSLTKESERYFLNAVIEQLVKETNFDLPDEFLRRMIRETSEQEIAEDQFEVQYANFINSMRWQLIESQLIVANDLMVKEEEMRNVVKSYFTGHLMNPAEDQEQDERLNKIVDSVLNNKEEATRLHDQLFDQKLLGFFKSNLKKDEKEMTYDEFVKMVTQKKE
jgi:trigger factor